MENFDSSFTAFMAVATIFLVWALFFAGKPKSKRRKDQRVLTEGDVIQINQRIIRYDGVTGRAVGRFIAERRVVNPNSGVGTPNRDKVYIGFSVCDKTDVYNNGTAKLFARANALQCYENPVKIPVFLHDDYLEFYRRCMAYFKGCELPLEVQLYNYKTKSYDLAIVGEGGYYFDRLIPEVESAKICPIAAVGIPSEIDCARCGRTDCPVVGTREPYTVPTELA